MQTVTTIGLDIAKSVFQVHRIGPCTTSPSAQASSTRWSRKRLWLSGHSVPCLSAAKRLQTRARPASTTFPNCRSVHGALAAHDHDSHAKLKVTNFQPSQTVNLMMGERGG